MLSEITLRASSALTNSTLDVQRRAGQEESPPALGLAFLAKILKVPHFADGSSPFGEKPLV